MIYYVVIFILSKLDIIKWTLFSFNVQTATQLFLTSFDQGIWIAFTSVSGKCIANGLIIKLNSYTWGGQTNAWEVWTLDFDK